MRNLVAAVFAACVAMLATSGIVAFATAAPEPRAVDLEIESIREVETALLAQVDTRIEAQLAQVRSRLLHP